MSSGNLTLGFLFGLLLIACSDPVNVVRADGVEVRVERAAVVIQNERTAKIVYHIVDGAFAARALSAPPCAHPDCPGVLPGESKVIPASEIGGWRESDRLLVSWWHVVQASSGEFEPDSIRSMAVTY